MLQWEDQAMAELQLTLTAAERKCLLEILERALKETRVEEHRTRAPAYREHVVQHEHCIAGMLEKLGQSPKA
jgi:hypothetical protein